MNPDRSLATGQRSLAAPEIEYPLEPALTGGCPEASTDEVQYPVGVDYAYDDLESALFDAPPKAGLERWQPLLPPLAPETRLGEGNTPLVSVPAVGDWLGLEEVYVKDESQNPTWSHKDRLNRCTVSAAAREGAAGVVASSTGNHGAAAAAYAARAGLPCVVFTASRTPPAVQAFIERYGAVLLAVDDIEVRQDAVNRLADEYGFHAVSSRTRVHTGHAWGPEGYKTIAYELYCQFDGSVPGTVAVPTCYAELLYGVWKGFRELESLGLADRTPSIVACEPGVRAPLRAAVAAGREIARVEPEPTEAYSIKATTSSVRGLRAIRESGGIVVGFSEAELEESHHRLARSGLWQEDSGAAGVAGLQALFELDSAHAGDGPVAVDADGEPVSAPELESPVVAIATSSGFKNGRTHEAPRVEPEWTAIREALEAHGVLGD
ncbi:threonine synthase [Natrononativus amylolyticus]|uniref:threonine synthase n=1 Tax=Natrononativus amylolyticus TaxID=2963434 RepID=UPI0020CF299B|nr:pyridoxal-phosphate dependent enzyme [Natrononativus amylolyticus]